MRIDPIKLKAKNRFNNDFYNSKDTIIDKFDYPPFDENTFRQRAVDLKERSFDREGLTTVLNQLNQNWGAPKATLHNIERLKDNNSVVVIGGQQAGLLTGPMFTIHKIISIIQLAKEQEERLNIPVIPVFWIAGEDHDFDEINHIKMKQNDRMKKYKIKQRVNKKVSMSKLEIDKGAARELVKRIFEELDETVHTKEIYDMIETELQNSKTYVDFFAKIIFRLFEEEGLVLIDSGNEIVRKAESRFFCDLIDKQPEISEGVYHAAQKLKNQGYTISLDVAEDDAHLFYHKDDERVLLVRTESGEWVGKMNECQFTTEELLEIAEDTPELLSNNVVTRPIMQEFLFPTLAFLGGLGEVGYWSVLKPAFQTLQLKMPPVLPRLSFTLVDQSVAKKLERYTLEPDSVINNGVDLERGNWLAAQTTPPLEVLTDQIKFSVERAHQPLREVASSMGPDLKELAEKNLFYLFEDIDFLRDRLMRNIEEKNKLAMSDFDDIQAGLYPEGGLQERNWNAVPLLNVYGTSFIKEMLRQSYTFSEKHYIVYL